MSSRPYSRKRRRRQSSRPLSVVGHDDGPGAAGAVADSVGSVSNTAQLGSPSAAGFDASSDGSENLSDFDCSDSSFGSSNSDSDDENEDREDEDGGSEGRAGSVDSVSESQNQSVTDTITAKNNNTTNIITNTDSPSTVVDKRSSSKLLHSKASKSSTNLAGIDDAAAQQTSNEYSTKNAGESVVMHWGVKPSAHTVYFTNHSSQTNKKLKNDMHDMAEISIHNSFSQVFVDCVPLMMCSPTGFEWISNRFNDPTLKTRLVQEFYEMHGQMKESMVKMTHLSSEPIEFDKDIVFPAVEAYFRGFTGFFIYSFKEVDNIIFNEFGEHLPFDGTKYETPENNLKDPFNRAAEDFDSNHSENSTEFFACSSEGKTVTGLNGYAEKLTIAAITATGISLLSFENSNNNNPKFSKDVDYKVATEYIATAKFFYEKYAYIGNSVIGIKGIVLLLFLFCCSINFKPALTLASVGARLAQEIGLHRQESYANIPVRETIQRVNTWWLLYCLEKDLCLKLTRPSCLDDRDISVPLPIVYPLNSNINIETDTNNDNKETRAIENHNALASLVRLYRIWNRIASDLLSPTSKLTVKERLVKHVLYEQEIKAWKQSVPVRYQPDSPNYGPIAGFPSRPTCDNVGFRQLIYYSHATYYFIVCSLNRQIAGHPSWIYRFTTGTDDGTPTTTTTSSATGAGGNTSSSETPNCINSAEDDQNKGFPKTSKKPSLPDSCKVRMNGLKDFDPSTVVSLLQEAQEALLKRNLKRTFTKNGVKLIVRRIALENPRMLQAERITVETCRKTVGLFLAFHPWNLVPIWQITYYGFNSFVGLFVSCIFSPLAEGTINNLAHMRRLIEVHDILYSNTKEYMFQTKMHEFLKTLVNALTKYVVQRRRDAKMENPEIPQFTTSSREQDKRQGNERNSGGDDAKKQSSSFGRRDTKSQLSNNNSNNTATTSSLSSSGFSYPIPTSNPSSSSHPANQQMYNESDGFGMTSPYGANDLLTAEELSQIPANEVSAYICRQQLNMLPSGNSQNPPILSRVNSSSQFTNTPPGSANGGCGFGSNGGFSTDSGFGTDNGGFGADNNNNNNNSGGFGANGLASNTGGGLSSNDFGPATTTNGSAAWSASFTDDLFDATDLQDFAPLSMMPLLAGAGFGEGEGSGHGNGGGSNRSGQPTVASQKKNVNAFGTASNTTNYSSIPTNSNSNSNTGTGTANTNTGNTSLPNSGFSNGEPMLDYLYPDFLIGSDINFCNSLFLGQAPSWMNSENIGLNLFQDDVLLGGGTGTGVGESYGNNGTGLLKSAKNRK